MNTNNTLHNLPPEILGAEIFTFLPKKHIVSNVALVCKKFNDITRKKWFINILSGINIKNINAEKLNSNNNFHFGSNSQKPSPFKVCEDFCFFIKMSEQSKKSQNKTDIKNTPKKHTKIKRITPIILEMFPKISQHIK